jgi:hypothetical protein
LMGNLRSAKTVRNSWPTAPVAPAMATLTDMTRLLICPMICGPQNTRSRRIQLGAVLNCKAPAIAGPQTVETSTSSFSSVASLSYSIVPSVYCSLKGDTGQEPLVN